MAIFSLIFLINKINPTMLIWYDWKCMTVDPVSLGIISLTFFARLPTVVSQTFRAFHESYFVVSGLSHVLRFYKST